MVDKLYTLTPLRIIGVKGGDVLHAMKDTDDGFSGFGEAYFSTVRKSAVKAWKRHNRMTLNLVVPKGEIKFVLFDGIQNDADNFHEVTLSRDNYQRLTVPPGIWMGFQGISDEESILLNLANIQHDPDEADSIGVDQLNYEWSL